MSSLSKHKKLTWSVVIFIDKESVKSACKFKSENGQILLAKTSQAAPHVTMPIPENKRQYCFSRPLKLEVHVRYWTTALRIILPFKTFKDQKSAEQIRRQFSQNWESLRGKSIVNCGQFSRDQYLTRTSNFSGQLKQYCPLFSGMGHCYVTVSIVLSANCVSLSVRCCLTAVRGFQRVCVLYHHGAAEDCYGWHEKLSWDILVSRICLSSSCILARKKSCVEDRRFARSSILFNSDLSYLLSTRLC